ncbi:hypothetical protein NDR87_26360 [Nocardia sp. CDC159]|uniref:Uncharacterized protein n=1 Tax=Nocardia pulmonis TaxID=2951408 RepID=A0A9X2IZJ0_9NOCA|nr:MULTISPECIES: hypothetical protein [Nocardia]MCM6774971.1 hypothetical protein [Nocardia pulmonis]MCM6789902.1 hypothetical protein [Nocardia sp. CDC159]
MAGITHPLRQLDLHSLLDVVEAMLEEGMDKKELEAMRRDLYRPEPGQHRVTGFSAQEEMAGFRSLQAQLAGLGR